MQILSVAGESANKAFESGLTPQVPANFKKPSKINSYSDYLKYAGQAAGILPVMPEADSPAMAPGPGPAGASCINPTQPLALQGPACALIGSLMRQDAELSACPESAYPLPCLYWRLCMPWQQCEVRCISPADCDRHCD